MKALSSLFAIVAFLIFSGCGTSNYMISQPIAIGTTEAINQVSVSPSNMSLVDYLKRVPGIQITGSNSNPDIRIRNAMSINGNSKPLFVIDRIPSGSEYTDIVNAVDVNDIKTITVLKDVSSTSMFGLRGANGVILITTIR